MSVKLALKKGIINVYLRCSEPCRLNGTAGLCTSASASRRSAKSLKQPVAGEAHDDLAQALEEGAEGAARARWPRRARDYLIVKVEATDPRGGKLTMTKKKVITGAQEGKKRRSARARPARRAWPRAVPASRRGRACAARPRAPTSIAASTAAACSSMLQAVAQHQRHRAEHGQRVGAAVARDVGRRAVHGLEQARPVAADRGAREHPERAGEHRRLVAEDVAEHVLGEDHVEVGRARDELHGGVVHQQVLELDAAGSRRPRAR